MSSFMRRLRSDLPALPRLPVPELRKTLERYLKSLQPFLLEHEARGGAPYGKAYEQRSEWAENFENGLGKLCQTRLKELDRASPNNWLNDNFWLNKAYHEWRAPLLINSNWWLAFHNDNMIPDDVLLQNVPSRSSGITTWQIRRAAWLTHRVLEFKYRIENQELHPDTTRTGIWIRENVDKMFNVGRVPRLNCDTLSPPVSPSDPDARKIHFMAHDWNYLISVYQDSGEPISPSLLEKLITAVVSDVETRLGNGEKAPAVGVLSSDDRDRWATNLEYILSLSSHNGEAHRKISSSIMGLSLDHRLNKLKRQTLDTFPALNSPEEVDGHLHNIRSGPDAHNRWFDQPLTIIVEPNTRAGAMGEHSPCDALVPSIVAEYALIEGVDASVFDGSRPSEAIAPGVDTWERLDWVTDEHIGREVVEAERRAKALIDDSDCGVTWFDEYGADWIKNEAKLSPDAYMQMVFQLAWYRSRGEFTATYETALTRSFRHGRTETIRTFTTDSRAFVLAMMNPSETSNRYRLLRQAIQNHSSLTREASTGRGIDRHLMGLRLMLKPGEQHPLFEDHLFQHSQTWKLSTSGLSAGLLFRGTGFGTVFEDGYGISYMIGSDMIKLGIESKFSQEATSTHAFSLAIRESLADIYELCSDRVGQIQSHL